MKRGLHKVPVVVVPGLTPAQVRAQFKRRVKMIREGMLSRDPECKWCYRELDEKTLTVDHVLAIADGGTNHYTNLVPACEPCNSMRGSLVARRQKMLDKLAKRSIAA